MTKLVLRIIFLSLLGTAAHAQAPQGRGNSPVQLLIKKDSMAFIINNKAFNVPKDAVIPLYNDAGEADSFRVFDFDNDGDYEILYEVDDPDFGFKSYLLACRVSKGKLIPVPFLSSRDTFQGVIVKNYRCCIDAKGDIFVDATNVLKNDRMYVQIDKYVYNRRSKCFVFADSKLFPGPIKRKSEITW